jgi:group I intron endonuclease
MASVPITNKNLLSVIDRIKGKVLKVYDNLYNDRKLFYKEFKGNTNSYIYIIVNKLNGKIYVGSTKSLKVRIVNYFNLALVRAQKGRPIHNAFLKYGLIHFAFIILEKVNTNIQNIEVRETYWIKHLKPEYNATKDAARNVGASHTSEIKLAISKKNLKDLFIFTMSLNNF